MKSQMGIQLERYRAPRGDRWLIIILITLIIICMLAIALVREKRAVRRELSLATAENRILKAEAAKLREQLVTLYTGYWMKLTDFEASRRAMLTANALFAELRRDVDIPRELHERCLRLAPTIATQIN